MRSIRTLAWATLLSMLMAALAPSANRLMAAADPAQVLMPFCSEAGMRMVELPSNSSDEPASPILPAQDCPYCTLQLSHALPGAASSTLPPMPAWRQMPPRFYQSAATSFVWSRAQARAPPSLS